MNMNNQTIFNLIVRFAYTMSCRCEDGDGRCSYRKDNECCFIGALIPPALYDPIIENAAPVSNPVNIGQSKLKEILNTIGIQDSQFEFLCCMQDIHDNPDNWADKHDMAKSFCTLADECGLNDDIVQECFD